MKPKHSHATQHGNDAETARSSVVVLTIVLAIAVLAGVVIHYWLRSTTGAAGVTTDAVAVDELEAARVGADLQQTAAPRSAVTVRKPFRSGTEEGPGRGAVGPGGTLEAEGGTGAVASAEAQQAMTRLSQLDVSHPLTAEQAAAVKQDLQQLV